MYKSILIYTFSTNAITTWKNKMFIYSSIVADIPQNLGILAWLSFSLFFNIQIEI